MQEIFQGPVCGGGRRAVWETQSLGWRFRPNSNTMGDTLLRRVMAFTKHCPWGGKWGGLKTYLPRILFPKRGLETPVSLHTWPRRRQVRHVNPPIYKTPVSFIRFSEKGPGGCLLFGGVFYLGVVLPPGGCLLFGHFFRTQLLCFFFYVRYGYWF